MKLSHSQAVATMVAVALMWSIAGVVTRHLEHARSFEITFWRSFFTVLSLVVILPVWRGRKALTELPWRSGPFWLSGVCWAVMFTAFMLALTLTTVANVLVTLAIGPLLTALFSRLFIGHALPVRTWMAIVAAGSGIAYMQYGHVSVGQGWAGFLVAFCVPIAGATQWTMMQHTHDLGHDADVPDMVPSVLLGAVISSLVTLPMALPFQASVHDMALLGGLGLVQLAIPCVLSVLAATVLKAPEVSLLALLEVIFGILLAWLGAGEAPGANVLTGGTLVIGALVANEVLSWRQRNGELAQNPSSTPRSI